jgi:FKBP-type peptidyl-prolyl cis-trans isomerase SlyD
VKVDFNHPLAGRALHFDVKVREIRPATPEELEHGHAHGPEGHEDEPEGSDGHQH